MLGFILIFFDKCFVIRILLFIIKVLNFFLVLVLIWKFIFGGILVILYKRGVLFIFVIICIFVFLYIVFILTIVVWREDFMVFMLDIIVVLFDFIFFIENFRFVLMVGGLDFDGCNIILVLEVCELCWNLSVVVVFCIGVYRDIVFVIMVNFLEFVIFLGLFILFNLKLNV